MNDLTSQELQQIEGGDIGFDTLFAVAFAAGLTASPLIAAATVGYAIGYWILDGLQ